MGHGLGIGKVSRGSGVKIPTIRYYEQIGLLPAPPRTAGGRRTYDESDIKRLSFIRHARELGFDIDQIQTLLALQDHPDQTCHDADSIANARLAEVVGKIASLTALQDELKRVIDGCSHGRVETCRVIEVLADHDNIKQKQNAD